MAKNVTVVPESLRNIEEHGEVTGFCFKADLSSARVLNGRGCFISIVDGFYIAVDGEVFPRDAQSVIIHGQPARSMDELKKAVWEHWDVGEYAWICVKKPGGLTPGEHKLTYMPSVLGAYFKAQDSWLTDPPPLDEQLKSPKDYENATYVCTLTEEENA